VTDVPDFRQRFAGLGVLELFELAARGTEDVSRGAIQELQEKGSREVFDQAAALARLGSPTQRAIAVLVLGQLGARAEVFFHERVDIAVDLASRDPDPAVLEAAAYALGHLADERGRDALLRLHDHSSSGVRLAVAGALPNCTRDGDEDTIDDLEVVEALIDLSRDPHDEVRNWPPSVWLARSRQTPRLCGRRWPIV
jgi:HEAT repeat protein